MVPDIGLEIGHRHRAFSGAEWTSDEDGARVGTGDGAEGGRRDGDIAKQGT